MKELMTYLLAIVIAAMPFYGAHNAYGQKLIAKDSVGLVIELKEKYGSTLTDTCTVAMEQCGFFVVVHRDNLSGWYPTSNYSLRVLERFSHD